MTFLSPSVAPARSKERGSRFWSTLPFVTGPSPAWIACSYGSGAVWPRADLNGTRYRAVQTSSIAITIHDRRCIIRCGPLRRSCILAGSDSYYFDTFSLARSTFSPPRDAPTMQDYTIFETQLIGE